jgi:DNA-binding CsgD family transcriptional regulator
MAQEVGEDVAVYRLYTQAVDRLRAAGLISQLAQALTSLAQCESYLGRWSSTQVHATEGLRLAADTEQTGMTGLFLANQAPIAAAQGRDQDCRRLALDARTMVAAHGTELAVAATEWGLGLLEMAGGRYQEAYEHLSGIAQPERWPDCNLFAPIAVFDLLEAAVLTNREDIAWHVLRSLERWAEPGSPPWARLTIHRTRAMLSTGSAAEAHFEAALAAASVRRFPVARTRLAYGEWLRRERRKTEARAQLRAALEAFDDLGARPWSDRARAELRATGETIPRRGPEAIEQLTPQELQIARLAASGLSNREIGAQLFLSPRTVGFHLYKVFPKLGIASRGDLRRVRLEADLAS